MNGVGSSKFINNTAQLAAQYNDFYLEITSPKISQIGNYKIIKEIGEGSFGKAYLATHVLLNINVVLKCGRIDDPNIVREIYYHKQLKHKNIVSLYEVIKTENHLWIALEYCQGGELYYYIYEKKRLELEECRNIFFQIVLAVKYVHSLNLSHRDLKLENILLADNKKSIVKLTDFGFIREFNPQSRKFLTTICGTTVYMAPEVLSQQKYSGFAVDIWSMGIILYTMLNGMMPFDDDNEMKIQQKIIHNEPMVFDHVPVEVNMLILKMLNKDPNQRPSLNEILNSSFLIDNYNKHLEKNSRRTVGGSGSGGDTESILSINQHYNSIDQPFESKIERDLLRKLQRIDFDIDELQATANNHEINLLTAFYELLLTQEFSKKKKRYYKERKRKLYEAKNSLRKSRKRVKSVLSLSDQSLVGAQPLERIMSSLSLASGKNSNRNSVIVTRKSTDRNEAVPVAPQLPKSSQTSRLNFEVPSPRATTTNVTLAPRSRRNSRDLSTLGSVSNTEVNAPLRRTVSFVPDERRLSAVITEEKEASKKSNKSGKILNKLQFWKKNKEESIDDTISRYSTKSNHSKSTNEKMLDTDDEMPLKINMRQNENPESLQLECNDSNATAVANPQPTLAQPPLLDLRRDSDPIQPAIPTESNQELPRTPPSGETTRFARTRPSSMISQISQLSKLSQMSTMLSESELDILDETDTMDEDEDYDDYVYESSINTSQDTRSQNPNTTASTAISQSRPSGKKRPSYRRSHVSDGSILTTSSITGTGGGGGSTPSSNALKRKNSLSRLRSNSSEDISEDSNRYSNIMSDDNMPIGRPVSPDLIKRRNIRTSATMPLINGNANILTPTAHSFAEANLHRNNINNNNNINHVNININNNNNNIPNTNSTDASRLSYHRAPSPPIGFKFSNKPSKKMMTTAVNGHYQPKAYLDTKQVEDWVNPRNNTSSAGTSNAFTKSSIYQPVINEEEEGEENI